MKTTGQRLCGFPVTAMRLDEYAALPSLSNVHPSDIAKMSIGYRFRFEGARTDGIYIVAEVVKFDEVLCDQWGASVLGCPDRWVNRYAVLLLADTGVGAPT